MIPERQMARSSRIQKESRIYRSSLKGVLRCKLESLLSNEEIAKKWGVWSCNIFVIHALQNLLWKTTKIKEKQP